jgi:HD-like signal output (HDOD) protein
MPDWEAERQVFGADHAHVGAYLLGIWGLGDGIVEAVAYHHHPDDYKGSGFCAVTAVHVANAMAEAQALPGENPIEVPGLDQQYLLREQFQSQLPRWRELCIAA